MTEPVGFRMKIGKPPNEDHPDWRSAEDVFEVTEMEATEGVFGMEVGRVLVQHHPVRDCAGRNCCIHNPSDHHMVEWPLVWREDRQLMERRCTHGVGHPDPDSIRYGRQFAGRDMGVHGCDGCCAPRKKAV